MKIKAIVIMSAIVISLMSVPSGLAEGECVVKVDSYTKPLGATFNVSINCTLTQPIKGYELTVFYDPEILQVNKLYEGTIFSGFDNFDSSGEFNNTEGVITKVFSVILGTENSSANGDLLTISFTTVGYGISAILLDKVGLCNETAYLARTIINSTIAVLEGNPPWDINNDHMCNINDLLLLLTSFGLTGSPGWIPEDIYQDGKISVMDVIIVAMNYGESW